MRYINQSISGAVIIAVFLLIIPFQLYANTAATTPAVISWAQLEQILDSRSFKSEEELFQLFHILYLQNKGTSLIIKNETISQLKKNIKTLFPLAECSSISMRGSKVTFEFIRAQDVALPNTWRQASLQTPTKLELYIFEPEPKNETEIEEKNKSIDKKQDATTDEILSLHFRVVEGYAKIHFSFLLRLFSGKLRDAEGSELVYQIDNNKRISRLTLNEITDLKNDKLSLLPYIQDDESQDYHWLDVRHPDFPGIKDIGFSKNRISFLGIEAELLPNDMISINGKEPKEDQLTSDYFNALLTSIKSFEKIGSNSRGIKYIRSFSYHFEERQMHLSMSLQGDHDQE